VKKLIVTLLITIFFQTLFANSKTPYDFELYSLQNHLFSSEKIRKKTETKVLVVDFFSMYCEPCKESLPLWEKMYKEYKKRGLTFVVIVLPVEDDRTKEIEKIEKYFNAQKVTFPVLFDKYSLVGKKYGVINKTGSASLPQIFVIDKNGKLISNETNHRKSITHIKKIISP